MKVAHLTTVDLSLRFLVLPQMLAVKNEGGEILGISAPGPYVAELEELGIRHVPLDSSTRGWSLRGDFQAAVRLWQVLRRERPDVLHTHNPKPGVYGRIVGRLAGVPIVVNTIHGLYATPDDRWSKRLVVYGLEWMAARFSDGELAQNVEDVSLLRRLRIVPAAKLAHLGNGVDLHRFDRKKAAVERAAARHELGVDDSTVVVGTVGRLVAEKGYLELFAAAMSLPSACQVVVVGPEDTEKGDALTASAIEEARDAGVRFLGMRHDVDRLYAAFDIFVLPSHREGFPRAAMEAAASGLPVVATDIRGCRQVVEDGVNGILVPVGDPARLAAAVTRLFHDAGLRDRFGAASALKAGHEFDERQIVEKVMATYRRIARQKSMDLGIPAGAGPVVVGPAAATEAAVAAHLHATGITSGFLSSLGPAFLSRLYGALMEWPGGTLLVARVAGEAIGFIAGCDDTPAFYRHFLRRHALGAAASAGRALLRPGTLRRVLETIRYGTGEGDTDTEPELLAMAVAEEHRGTGVGRRLVDALLAMAGSPGTMTVVVGAGNEAATALYRAAGFEDEQPIEVHSGEPSLRLTWTAP